MTEIFTGNTVEEAKNAASAKFGVPKEKINFEVIEEGKKGFLGIGRTDAKVKATFVPVASTAAQSKPVEVKKSEPAAQSKPVEVKKSEPAAQPKPVEVKKSEPVAAPAIASETQVKAVDESKNEFVNHPNEDEEEYSLDKFTLIENDADLNEKVKIAADYIKSILAAMKITAELKIYQNEKAAIINIESDSNGTIIGRRGETLDAIQYLSSMISNKGDKEYFRITIDCFGYRAKRKVTLEQLAEKCAKSVLRTGRSQPLEPMNPYERRVIHSAISKIEGVSSRSVGDEPYRKIIISSVNSRRTFNDRRPNNNRNVRNDRNDRRNNAPHKNFNEREEIHHESKSIDLSTSFEKDYKRPLPDDKIDGELYGKIEF